MGIHQLHGFIQRNCRDAIRIVNLSELKNKTIVIDTSIYLYKYAGEGHLIEGMYNLIIVLLNYKIIPIFVFDGKPITEKNELLHERKEKKKKSLFEYYKLREKLLLDGETEENLRKNTYLNKYKRDSTRINAEQISEIKKLMELLGVTYYQAENEADSVCAYLTKNDDIWGCLSEDTDMFVYGCSYVLRYISLMNHTAVIYNQNKILKKLDITQKNFINICIIAGSDYNIRNGLTIQKAYKLYLEYKKCRVKNKKGKKIDHADAFMDWLVKNRNIDFAKEEFDKIKDIYTMKSICVEKMNISERSIIQQENLRIFLEKYNFIFINK